MKSLENIKFAFETFRSKKLRTALTLLGVIIGTSAVIIIGSVAKSGHHIIFRELKTFGLNSVWVYRHYDDGIKKKTISGSGIRYQDISLLESKVKTVEHFSPIVEKWRELAKHKSNYVKSRVVATNSHYYKTNNDNLKEGRFLDSSDIQNRQKVCVIGSKIANELFGNQHAIGKKIKVLQDKFTVVGILKEKDRSFLASIGSSGGKDANNRIIIPITVYLQQNNTKEISYILASVNNPELARNASEKIISILSKIHHYKFKYKADSMQEYIKTANIILSIVSWIGTIAAIVSLFVGGIGIMNIISASVVERRKEIGIRRSLGARKKDIFWQFFIESTLVGVMGGIIGIIIGFVFIILIMILSNKPILFAPLYILISFVFSVITGMLSGLYPAMQAANLDPVESLHSE